MLGQIDVSIIILNYNTFQMTCDCIDSIIEKTTNITYEIILVDNASIECDASLFLEKYSFINLVKSEENLGFSKGNNLGIQYAKGKVILLLNSDTVLQNNAVGLCYWKLITSEKIGLITSKLIYPTGEVQKQCRRFDRISLLLFELFRLHKLLSKAQRGKLLLGGYFNHTEVIYPERIWGTFFMFKREILLKFPENKLADTFFMYGEDNEWCYQLQKFTDLSILYWPEAVVVHKIGGSHFGEEKLRVILENKRVYMTKYYGVVKTKIFFMLQKIFFY